MVNMLCFLAIVKTKSKIDDKIINFWRVKAMGTVL